MSISNTRREAGISSCGQKSVDWSPSLDQCLRPHQYSEFHYQMLSTEAINRVSQFYVKEIFLIHKPFPAQESHYEFCPQRISGSCV